MIKKSEFSVSNRGRICPLLLFCAVVFEIAFFWPAAAFGFVFLLFFFDPKTEKYRLFWTETGASSASTNDAVKKEINHFLHKLQQNLKNRNSKVLELKPSLFLHCLFSERFVFLFDSSQKVGKARIFLLRRVWSWIRRRTLRKMTFLKFLKWKVWSFDWKMSSKL